MSETESQDKTFSFLSKTQLVKLRLQAMRAGVWFRGLHRIDRVLVDLTIRVASNVRSLALARCILTVMGKLEGLMESSLLRVSLGIGLQLAEKLSIIAQKWGNSSAKSWPSNSPFVNFLSVMHMNEPATVNYKFEIAR